MRTNATSKYGFRIRTRNGLTLDRLLIHARDAADATRKIEQMYPYCQVLECRPPKGPASIATAELAPVVSLVTRRRVAGSGARPTGVYDAGNSLLTRCA